MTTISVTPWFFDWILKACSVGLTGTVWSSSPPISNSGPRSGFFELTFTSLNGLRLAVTTWKIGFPAAATWNSSYSSRASLSSRVFAQPYWKASNERVTPCFRLFPGCATTGAEDFSDESGTDNTPWNGAGSTATVATDSPPPAIFWAIRPPKEWPTTAGLSVSAAIASR